MKEYIDQLINTCVGLGTARTLEVLGISSGEISQRRARSVYGKWFAENERRGRIYPCRVDNGRNGTRWFKVSDILAVKAADIAEATLR